MIALTIPLSLMAEVQNGYMMRISLVRLMWEFDIELQDPSKLNYYWGLSLIAPAVNTRVTGRHPAKQKPYP